MFLQGIERWVCCLTLSFHTSIDSWPVVNKKVEDFHAHKWVDLRKKEEARLRLIEECNKGQSGRLSSALHVPFRLTRVLLLVTADMDSFLHGPKWLVGA